VVVLDGICAVGVSLWANCSSLCIDACVVVYRTSRILTSSTWQSSHTRWTEYTQCAQQLLGKVPSSSQQGAKQFTFSTPAHSIYTSGEMQSCKIVTDDDFSSHECLGQD